LPPVVESTAAMSFASVAVRWLAARKVPMAVFSLVTAPVAVSPLNVIVSEPVAAEFSPVIETIAVVLVPS